MPDNPDYMSQFPNNMLGNLLRAQVEIKHEFYREYVRQDHDHETVSKISHTAAMILVQTSPYRPLLDDYHIDKDAARDLNIIPLRIMNKGAVRITPTLTFRNALHKAHHASKLPSGDHEWWDTFRGWLNNWYRHEASDFELWVYNHDGSYLLTRPRRKPMISMLNQKLQQILQGIDARGLGDAPHKARYAVCQLGDDLGLTLEDEGEINKRLSNKIKFPHIKRNPPEAIIIDVQEDPHTITIDLQEIQE